MARSAWVRTSCWRSWKSSSRSSRRTFGSTGPNGIPSAGAAGQAQSTSRPSACCAVSKRRNLPQPARRRKRSEEVARPHPARPAPRTGPTSPLAGEVGPVRGAGLAGWGRATSSDLFRRRAGWGKFLLFETAQHAEGLLVDCACPAAQADGIPFGPVDPNVRRLDLELLFQLRQQLVRTHAERAIAMQCRDLAVWRSEPFDGLGPGAVQWLCSDTGPQPATPVKEVIPLLHEHLSQPLLKHIGGTVDAGLDHDCERGVEDRIRGDDLSPLCPGL